MRALLVFLFVLNANLVALLETTTETKVSVGNSNTPSLITTTTSSSITSTSSGGGVTSCNINDTSCISTSTDSSVATTTTELKKNATLKLSAKLKNATESTTLKPLASTTPMPPKFEQELDEFSLDACTCNLQRGFCDINCCCDEDCSHEDKTVFKSCKREANFHRDTSFCKYMDFIYLNNTPYKWEVNQNGLFCIAKSNLPAKYTVQKKEPITTLEEAQLQKRNKYSWGNLEYKEAQEFAAFNSSESFVFASKIWILKNHSLELFSLPDNFVTNACLIKKNMKFLQNFKSKCSQMVTSENNPSLNAETYFKNISFVRAPRYLNVSVLKKSFHNCSNKVCLPIEAKICNENYENCFNISNNTSMLVSCHRNPIDNENYCVNLTQKVKYNFYHNGTWGLTKIQLFLVLKNISYPLRAEHVEFPQRFEVNYFWSNYSFNYSSLMSGNPGYIISKPILIGRVLKINSSKSQILRNPKDFSDNFLILPANIKGLCVLSNHTHVALEFGYNMILKCTIKASLVVKNTTATEGCKKIQKIIFDYWPITHGNVSGVNKVVGNFGNANQTLWSDWTEILSNQNPHKILNETNGNFTVRSLICRNIVTGVGIDIFHARVDYKDLRNQEKILGVSYRFGSGGSFEFDLSDGKVNFEIVLREDVMFFDITSERVTKFVDPPKFTITLPYDFFYPFVKVGNRGANLCGWNILSFLVLSKSVTFF